MSVNNRYARERLEAALRDHRAGRLREAIAGYEELLSADEGNADLLQRLGVALAQSGRPDAAVEFLGRSVTLEPDRPAVLLNLARALHELRRDEEALRCCDRALALDANAGGAYRVRSAVLAALGRSEESLASIGQAVRLAPQDAAAIDDLGVALEAAGRTQDALACFERAIALDPALAAAHHHFAALAARLGEHVRALKAFDSALKLQPHQAAIHSNRGNALKELGNLPEALKSYATALAIEPKNLDTLHNRAVVLALHGQYAEALRDYDYLLASHASPKAAHLIGRAATLVALGRNAEALDCADQALALAPGDVAAHIQRGVALLRLERHAEAVASFDRALEMQADLPEVLNNRGVALAALGRAPEALDSFLRSLAFKVSSADTHTNLGVVLKTLGRHDEAAASFGRALWHKPGDPTASFEAAFLHLTRGEFKQGWPLYEARFRVPALGIPPRTFAAPRWNGSDTLDGRKILVHAEQGLGDTLQFCRYLPLLAARGASVVFEVMPSLKALLESLPGEVRVLGRGEPIPPVDYHCPLLSLPLAFGTEAATIPADVPYLAADPQRTARWAERLRGVAPLRVGIAWQGNPEVERLIWARGRSMPLTALAALARVPGASLISLQKGAGSEQLAHVPRAGCIVDLGAELDTGGDAFVDTAAAMVGLDLVITTDTSIAHLAGALGRPVWVALSAAADWRWLLERDDSPWYPTMRLFRQSRAGEWDSVIAALAAALAAATERV